MLIFFILGLVSSIFQLVVLREFTFSIAKNEFAFLAGAGIWLIFCSLGSLASKKTNYFLFRFLPVIWALVFCFSVSLIHLVKLLSGLSYYETSSLGFALYWGLVLVGSVSFLNGFSFSLFSRRYLSKYDYLPKTFANFFIYEAAGFFAGGVIFTFFLSGYRNPFLFTFLSLLLFLTTDLKIAKKVLPLLLAITISGVSVLSFRIILEAEFKGAEILKDIGSAYGPVILAKKYGVESLYVNGSLTSSSEDLAWNEQFIHTSLSAAKGIKNVLFVGSDYGGQVGEILKYDIASLDWLDINPALLSLNREKLIKNNDSRLAFFIDDPRLYIQNTGKKYDFIIMNMPPPSNLVFNRYFSVEFFELVKKRLTIEGSFSFHIPAKRDILSPRILKFDSCILNTLDKVFQNKLLVPLDSMIVIANNRKPGLNEDLVDNFIHTGIATDYFTRYHLKDSLDSSRSIYLENMLDKQIGVNSDFYPRGFLYYLLLDQAKFYPNIIVNIQQTKVKIIGIFIVIVILGAFLSRLGKGRRAILEASFIGFVSIGLNSIIFILFQLQSGAFFQKAGVLFGLFMLGLGVASWWLNLQIKMFREEGQQLVYFYLAWAVLVFSLFFGMLFFKDIFNYRFVFYGYSFVSGALTGIAYPLFTRLALNRNFKPKNIAVSVYAADLGGAFLGTITFSIFLIPFFGVFNSLLALLSSIVIFMAISCLPYHR